MTTPSQGIGLLDPERAERVRALFDSVVTLDGTSRLELLDGERTRAPEIVREVEHLLASDTGSIAFLDAAVAGVAKEILRTHEPPAGRTKPESSELRLRIPGFEILREIGHGGMGVVYEARQLVPSRTVAIKVIRQEFTTPDSTARFLHEADALAKLEHPGIARLYGVGFVDEQRKAPYIVMELLHGTTLRGWGMSEHPRERVLTMMTELCDAVDHAHRRGVVHRDLKPGNVFVDGDHHPRVLDFGIAKLTGNAAETVSTSMGQIMGTLGYVSPEQLLGDPAAVDSRCDVYALGVMLYELLAGKVPVEYHALSPAQFIARLHQSRPAPLSTHNRTLRGDLEAIAAKALETNPAARYQSAGDLARDLVRHAAGEPISARPLTAWYATQKFLARNRAVAAGVALILGVATVGGVWIAKENAKAIAARAAEAASSERAAETASFLKRMIQSATPEVARGRGTSVRGVLDAAAADLASTPGLTPLLEAELSQIFAESYSSLTEYRSALPHAGRAFDLYARALGQDDPKTLTAQMRYATALTRTFEREKSIAHFQDAFARAQVVLGHGHPKTVECALGLALALTINQAGPFAESDRLLADVERAFRADPASYGTLPVLLKIAQADLAARQRLHAEAIRLADEAAEMISRLANPDPAFLVHPMVTKAAALSFAGRYAEAEAILLTSLRTAQEILGPEHLLTARVEEELAKAIRDGKGPDNNRRSLPYLRRAYETRRVCQGPLAVTTRVLGVDLCYALINLEECDQAQALFDQRIADKGATPAGQSHWTGIDAWLEFNLGFCRHDLARMEAVASALEGTTYASQAVSRLALMRTKPPASKPVPSGVGPQER